jgi:hypothetical protein
MNPLNAAVRNGSAHRRLLALVCLTTALVMLPGAAVSQPVLTFKRVTVNWPTIEVYMAVGCDGSPAYNMTKENFHILENGVEVPDFTLWCPDPTVRCAISAALVADVSGSMRGAGAAGAAQHLRAWVDLMDGQVDEAALIETGREISIRQPMTTNKQLLRQAIDSLHASGSSSIYDGVMEGLRYLIEKGYNQCRAVIVFTDGWDNTSNAAIAEVISLANRHRIRVFTVGVGPVIQSVELEQIALLTGGRYYQNPNAGQMAAIYSEISAIIFQGWQECILTYERDCAEGGMRTVELQLRDFCGGSDSKTKTYRAPLDSTTFFMQRMRIGELVFPRADAVAVPLLLDATPPGGLLRPFDITIHSGANGSRLFDVSIPGGSPFNGAPLIIDRDMDSVRLRLTDTVSAQGSGTLLELHFSTQGIYDSTWFPLTAEIRDVGLTCAATQVDSGGYLIVPRLLPRITPEGAQMLCSGGSLELKANTGFVSYRWSTGDTTRSTTVTAEGSYFVEVVDTVGDTLRSESVMVGEWPERKVWLEAEGPLTVCRGGKVSFHVAGDTANAKIYWQTRGYPSPKYTSEAPDKVWATVVDEHGCRFPTDSIRTIAIDPPVTLNVPGPTVYVCHGDSIELRVEEEYPFYYWETGFLEGDSTRSVMAHAGGGWRGTGKYSVYVRDTNGCTGSWHTIYVREYPEHPLTFTPSQRIVLCPGGEAEVSVAEEFASYRWSTGDTSRAITVREAGTITVEGVSSDGCVTRSAPFEIEMVDTPRPHISPGRYSALCPDDNVLLDAGDGYAAYRWSTGDTTRIIEVGYEGPFHVDAMAHGGCWGRSDTLLLQREMESVPAITWEGDLLLCFGDTLTLEAPAGYARYMWNTHDTTRTIAVREPGMYAVMVMSTGGCEGISDPVYVQVRTPEKPVIVQQGLLLSTTSRVLSHQWFLDGRPISGATGPLYTVSETGRYAVQVVDSCGAVLMSDEHPVTTLGTDKQPAGFRLELYPDPSDGLIHLAVTGARGAVQAELMDLLGRRIAQWRWTAGNDGSLRETIDFRAAPRGMYLLRIAHSDGVIVRRLVKIP